MGSSWTGHVGTDELAALLELLHVARSRFTSIEARMRISYDLRVLRNASRTGSPLGPVPDVTAGTRVAGRTDHVSFISDAKYRVQSESLGPGFLHIKDGERTSSPDPVEVSATGIYEQVAFMNAADSYRQMMWDPNLLIPEMWFEPLGRQVIANREGLKVRARPRWTSHDYIVVSPWADAYELVVDLERGVLLRFGCWFQGEEGIADEVMEITFDRSLPEELFAI
jgi:hypothetical protein